MKFDILLSEQGKIHSHSTKQSPRTEILLKALFLLRQGQTPTETIISCELINDKRPTNKVKLHNH